MDITFLKRTDAESEQRLLPLRSTPLHKHGPGTRVSHYQDPRTVTRIQLDGLRDARLLPRLARALCQVREYETTFMEVTNATPVSKQTLC